jgi:hypothetical protein
VSKSLVYFLLDPVLNTVKIGASKHPEKRKDHLQTCTSSELILIRSVDVEPISGFDAERILHHKFEQSRVRGEWFQGTPEILDFAKNGDVKHEVSKVLGDITPIMIGSEMWRIFPIDDKVEINFRFNVPEKRIRKIIESVKEALEIQD